MSELWRKENVTSGHCPDDLSLLVLVGSVLSLVSCDNDKPANNCLYHNALIVPCFKLEAQLTLTTIMQTLFLFCHLLVSHGNKESSKMHVNLDL